MIYQKSRNSFIILFITMLTVFTGCHNSTDVIETQITQMILIPTDFKQIAVSTESRQAVGIKTL